MQRRISTRNENLINTRTSQPSPTADYYEPLLLRAVNNNIYHPDEKASFVCLNFIRLSVVYLYALFLYPSDSNFVERRKRQTSNHATLFVKFYDKCGRCCSKSNNSRRFQKLSDALKRVDFHKHFKRPFTILSIHTYMCMWSIDI